MSRSLNGRHRIVTYTSPGACLSIKGVIACKQGQLDTDMGSVCRTSGVTSLVANPVPPLLMIKLIGSALSLQLLITFWIASTLSGTISVSATSHWSLPESPKTFLRIGIHLSVEGSWNAVSDTIRMAAFSFGCVVLMLVIKVTLLVELLSRNVVLARA
jgi:hypothetical protein